MFRYSIQAGKVGLFVAIMALQACGTFSGTDFVPSSSAMLAPKPPDEDVLVFFEGSPPERPFEIIGMVYAHKTAVTKFQSADPQEIVEMLKAEAREHGADAIIDVRISPVEGAPRTRKLGQAKAVVFQ